MSDTTQYIVEKVGALDPDGEIGLLVGPIFDTESGQMMVGIQSAGAPAPVVASPEVAIASAAQMLEAAQYVIEHRGHATPELLEAVQRAEAAADAITNTPDDGLAEFHEAYPGAAFNETA